NYKSNDAEANKTLALVKEFDVQAELLKFNVADKIEVDSVLGKWIEQHSGETIEILVNNAGVRQDALMIFMSDNQWKDVIGSSLDAFFYVTQLVIKNML